MSNFTTGDTAPALTVSCGTDLTGATVSMHIQKPSATILTANGTITDAINGLVEYDWQAGDLSEPGVWAVEAQITFSNGEIQTIGPATFHVRQQIA